MNTDCFPIDNYILHVQESVNPTINLYAQTMGQRRMLYIRMFYVVKNTYIGLSCMCHEVVCRLTSCFSTDEITYRDTNNDRDTGNINDDRDTGNINDDREPQREITDWDTRTQITTGTQEYT